MQVYSTLMKIANKQKYQIFIYMGIFITLMALMTNLQGGDETEYTDTKCNLAIFDLDNTDASKKLVDYLSSVHDIKEIEDDESVILDTLYLLNIDYILYINKGYSENGSLTNIKRPGSTEGSYVDNQIKTYESSLKALMTAGYSPDEAYEKTLKSLDSDGLVSMLEQKNESRPKSYYAFSFVPYVVAMLIFNIIGPLLVAYNRKDVRDRAFVSPLSDRSRNIQLGLALLTLSVIFWLIFAVIGFLFTGTDLFDGTRPLLLVNIMLGILVPIAFITIIGCFDIKPQTISAISNIYGLGTAFLGGVFVPIEIFGDGMRTLAHFMPTYWYIQFMEGAFEGENDGLLVAALMQLLFAVIFAVIGMIVSKKKKMSV